MIWVYNFPYMFRLPNFQVSVDITVNNPTREEFLAGKFEKKLDEIEDYSIAKLMNAGLSTISSNEGVIFSLPDDDSDFLQFWHEPDHYVMDYMVVPQTWHNRHVYWRLRTVLSQADYRPLPRHDLSKWSFKLGIHKYYYWSETTTVRHVALDISEKPDTISTLGQACITYMYQIKPTQPLNVTFVSNKKYWI